MPEEINRVLTDQVADLLLTPSEDGDVNLLREGIPRSKIRLVGNTMIDTLVQLLPLSADLAPKDLPPRYALVTLHRPSNVDDPAALRELCEVLNWLSTQMEVFFPVPPPNSPAVAGIRVSCAFARAALVVPNSPISNSWGCSSAPPLF